ncbi:MAG: STAS domain-containing protein [Pseudomonadota bacterium]
MAQESAKHELAARAAPGADPLFAFLTENRKSPVSLSLAEVDRMDAIRLQTILSAQCQWMSDDVTFEITDVSEACSKSLRLLGLDPSYFQMDAQS